MAMLILGASQCKYLHLLKIAEPLTIHYHSGDRIQDVCPEVWDHLKDFDSVVLQLGTNNVPQEVPSQSAEKFEFLVKKILAANPQIKIYISAILPRGDNLYLKDNVQEKKRALVDLFNTKAWVLNNLLRKIALR